MPLDVFGDERFLDEVGQRREKPGAHAMRSSEPLDRFRSIFEDELENRGSLPISQGAGREKRSDTRIRVRGAHPTTNSIEGTLPWPGDKALLDVAEVIFVVLRDQADNRRVAPAYLFDEISPLVELPGRF
jgi:hypothetical protein